MFSLGIRNYQHWIFCWIINSYILSMFVFVDNHPLYLLYFTENSEVIILYYLQRIFIFFTSIFRPILVVGSIVPGSFILFLVFEFVLLFFLVLEDLFYFCFGKIEHTGQECFHFFSVGVGGVVILGLGLSFGCEIFVALLPHVLFKILYGGDDCLLFLNKR